MSVIFDPGRRGFDPRLPLFPLNNLLGTHFRCTPKYSTKSFVALFRAGLPQLDGGLDPARCTRFDLRPMCARVDQRLTSDRPSLISVEWVRRITWKLTHPSPASSSFGNLRIVFVEPLQKSQPRRGAFFKKLAILLGFLNDDREPKKPFREVSGFRTISDCSEDAELPFENVLDRMAGSDPGVTDYVLEVTARCLQCGVKIDENTCGLGGARLTVSVNGDDRDRGHRELLRRGMIRRKCAGFL